MASGLCSWDFCCLEPYGPLGTGSRSLGRLRSKNLINSYSPKYVSESPIIVTLKLGNKRIARLLYTENYKMSLKETEDLKRGTGRLLLRAILPEVTYTFNTIPTENPNRRLDRNSN